MARAGAGWCSIVAVLACTTKPVPSPTSSELPPSARAVEPPGPGPTVDPPHPWPITLLDVRGHERLPDAPSPSVWVTLEGIAATTASGGIQPIGELQHGEVDPRLGHFEHALQSTLAEHAEKGVLTFWVDERSPAVTVESALDASQAAGFVEWAFVVGKPGERELVRAHAAPGADDCDDGGAGGSGWLDLELTWDEGRVLAMLVERRSESDSPSTPLTVPLDLGEGKCIVPGGARPDVTVLRKTLDELCTVADGRRFALRVRPGDAKDMGDVLWALAADARAPEGCRSSTILDLHSRPSPVFLRQGYRNCDHARAVRDATASFEWMCRWRYAREQWPCNPRRCPYDWPPRHPFPDIRAAKPTVEGPLEADVERRVTRAHLNEVRSCYRLALATNPELEGRVELRYTIDGQGAAVAKVVSSTVNDETLHRCLVEAFEGWQHARPHGRGKVVVMQTLELELRE